MCPKFRRKTEGGRIFEVTSAFEDCGTVFGNLFCYYITLKKKRKKILLQNANKVINVINQSKSAE